MGVSICLLNALYIFTFVQCLHSAVWMAGTKNSFVGDTRGRKFFNAKMPQDFSRISWHPKLHSERSRHTGKESILELILKTPVRHNSASFLQWLRPVVVCSYCLSSKWLSSQLLRVWNLQENEPERYQGHPIWQQIRRKVSSLWSGKLKVTQVTSLGKVKNAKKIINAEINLQAHQLTGAGPAGRLCPINRSAGAKAARGWWQKMWAHHWVGQGDKGQVTKDIGWSMFLIAFYALVFIAKICLQYSWEPETHTWESLE